MEGKCCGPLLGCFGVAKRDFIFVGVLIETGDLNVLAAFVVHFIFLNKDLNYLNKEATNSYWNDIYYLNNQ